MRSRTTQLQICISESQKILIFFAGDVTFQENGVKMTYVSVCFLSNFQKQMV